MPDYHKIYNHMYRKRYHHNYKTWHGKALADWLLDNAEFRNVLDLGCSRGRSLEYYEVLNDKAAYGIEVAKDAFEDAKARGYKVIHDSVTNIRSHFGESCFDCIVSSEFLEHLDQGDALRCIADIAWLLRPGGYTAHQIATAPASSGRADVKQLGIPNLHLTVQCINWWRDAFERRGFTFLHGTPRQLYFQRLDQGEPADAEA